MTAQAHAQASVGALLGAGSAAWAAQPALTTDDGTRISYRQLQGLAERLAADLVRAAGGSSLRGQRIAIVAPNQPVLPIALFASWVAGAVAVPLSARLREYELRRMLADAQPLVIVSVAEHGGYALAHALEEITGELPGVRRCLIVDRHEGAVEHEIAGRDPRAASEPAALPGERVAALLYTSGTTGEPKGALIGHARLVAEAHSLAELLAPGPQDVAVLPIPVAHAFGLSCLLASLAGGAVTALVDPGVSLAPVADAARRERASMLHGSPALFAGLLKGPPAALETVRTGLVAGAPPPPALLEELDRRGQRILNVYGMTELGAACACRADDPPEIRFTTAGRPLPGYELRICAGELQVRGPYVTEGYHLRPDLSQEAFAAEGWFRTGDLGSLDDRGNLRLLGRAKELANVGGFNVMPGEVEGLLLSHPDVAQAAVVAVPHERLGEALKAFVVPRSGAQLERGDLLRYMRSRIAGYKLPYVVEIRDELPLLASGKPDRGALAGG